MVARLIENPTQFISQATTTDWLLITFAVALFIFLALTFKKLPRVVAKLGYTTTAFRTKEWLETKARITKTYYSYTETYSQDHMILGSALSSKLKPMLATVEFKDANNNPLTSEIVLLANSFREGDVITIQYNPNNPAKAIQVTQPS